MLMEVHCPSCGMRLRIDQKFAGRKGRCPNCKQKMMIPAMDAPGVMLISPEVAEAREEQGEAAAPSEEGKKEGAESVYVLPPEERRRYTAPTIEITEGLPKWMGVSIGIHAVAFSILWLIGAVLVLAPPPRSRHIVVQGRFIEAETPQMMKDLLVKDEPRPKMEDILTSTSPVDVNTNVKPVVGDVTGMPNVATAIPGGGDNSGPPVIGFDAGAVGGWGSLGGSGRGFTPGSTGVGRSQTTFFGNKAKQGAESIIFIIDASTTMGQIGGRFERALTELRASVEKLSAGHRFNIIFFDEKPLKWQEHMTVASPENKRAALEFVETMRDFKGSGTLPVPPMKEAMKDNPEVIFLLTDGDFLSDDSAELLAMSKEKKIRVYPIGFGEKVNEPLLQKLADQSGGRYTPAKM